MASLALRNTDFELDPRYEFDAPQFCDLASVAAGTEGDLETADKWFDRHLNGSAAGRRKHWAASNVFSTDTGAVHVEDTAAPERRGGSGEMDVCEDNDAFDAMDIDTPKAQRPQEARRPVTRSQTKAQPTKSRVLQQISASALNSDLGERRQFTTAKKPMKTPVVSSMVKSSAKRSLQPIVQLPVRSTKALTEPMDFELQTAKRLRPLGMQTRSQTPFKEEFVPLAVQTELFHVGTNDRFAAAESRVAPKPESLLPVQLTNPKTPYLRSKARALSRAVTMREPCTAEDTFTSKGPSSAAAPRAAFAAAARGERAHPTKPKPFNFATDRRCGASAKALAGQQQQQHAMPAKERKPPAQGGTTMAETPKLKTRDRAMQRGFVFKAEGNGTVVSSTQRKQKAALKAASIQRGPTKPRPFHFQTDKRVGAGSSHTAKPEPPYQFRARPVPVSNEVKTFVKQQHRPLTIPESPGLMSKQRHAKYQEELHRRIEEEEHRRKEATNFKARGLPISQRFMPHPPTNPLTVPQEPHFRLDDRAAHRSEFDRAQAEREKAAEVERQAELAAQKAREELEVRRLRRSMVPKARAVPDFAHPFHPKPSAAPLTEARSPMLGVRTRRSQQHFQ